MNAETAESPHRLARLCLKIRSGGTPKVDRPDFYDGQIPFVTIEDMTSSARVVSQTTKTITEAGLQSSNCWLVPAGSILYSIYATLGVTRIAGREAATNQAILSLVPDPDAVDRDFLFYFLSSLEAGIQKHASHTTQSNLNAGIVREFRVPRFQKPEQGAVARVLTAVDHAMEQTEALLAKHERIKAGLMHDLLTRGLDAHGRLRDPVTHKFKPSPLGSIPEDWEVRSLGSIAEINSGVTLGKDIKGEDTIELPYLRVANVQDGYLDLSEIKTIRVYRDEVPRYLLQQGDVLMNEGGDFDKLGRGTVWRAEIPDCLHQNHVFRVRPDREKLSSDFLAMFSASPRGKKFFVLNSKQSTNLASINSTQLKGFPIARPSTDEQDRIVAKLDAQIADARSLQTHLAKLRRLKTGLMQDLLTGRVSVAPLLSPSTP